MGVSEGPVREDPGTYQTLAPSNLFRMPSNTVTGCDAQVYPPMSDQLRSLGIRLHEGYDAEQLDQYSADLYVVGNAMVRGMPVVEMRRDARSPKRLLGLPIVTCVTK